MTTETRTVTVGSVARKHAPEGSARKWVRYSLIDSDDKFVGSTFDKAIGEALDNFGGKLVEVDLEVKEGSEGGKLIDLKAVRLAPQGGGGNGSAPTAAERDTRITRSVALKAAVDYWASGAESRTPSDVLATANVFDAWLRGEEGTPSDEEIPF